MYYSVFFLFHLPNGLLFYEWPHKKLKKEVFFSISFFVFCNEFRKIFYFNYPIDRFLRISSIFLHK